MSQKLNTAWLWVVAGDTYAEGRLASARTQPIHLVARTTYLGAQCGFAFGSAVALSAAVSRSCCSSAASRCFASPHAAAAIAEFAAAATWLRRRWWWSRYTQKRHRSRLIG